MKIKDNIPWFPVSGLLFYLFIFLLWTINLIPSPTEILIFLEYLYKSYGLIGLFIASFLESIAYIGLYFPGSFIVALAVFLSDGSFISLLLISITVAIALTLTAIINYKFGHYLSMKNKKLPKMNSKGIFLAILHPNTLAFYFVNHGFKRKQFKTILLVPILMLPYGMICGYILFFFKKYLKMALENPFIVIIILLIWLIVAILIQIFSNKKTNQT